MLAELTTESSNYVILHFCANLLSHDNQLKIVYNDKMVHELTISVELGYIIHIQYQLCSIVFWIYLCLCKKNTILYPNVSEPIYSSSSLLYLASTFLAIPMAQTPMSNSLAQQDHHSLLELLLSAIHLEKWLQTEIKNNQ